MYYFDWLVSPIDLSKRKMDSLKAELSRKAAQTKGSSSRREAVSSPRNLSYPNFLASKEVGNGNKFTQLKEAAKLSLLPASKRGGHLGVQSTVAADDDEEERLLLEKSRIAMEEKTKRYNELLRKAQADVLSGSELEGETYDGNYDDDDDDEDDFYDGAAEGDGDAYSSYSGYMRKMRRFKESQTKAGLLVNFAKKVAQADGSVCLSASNTALVEYVDEFGRTRRVSALEYETIKKEQGLFQNRSSHEPFFNNQGSDGSNNYTCDSAEGDSFLERPKDVHFDPTWEVRSYGVGHYKFSRDEAERERQMAELKDLDQLFKRARSEAKSSRDSAAG